MWVDNKIIFIALLIVGISNPFNTNNVPTEIKPTDIGIVNFDKLLNCVLFEIKGNIKSPVFF